MLLAPPYWAGLWGILLFFQFRNAVRWAYHVVHTDVVGQCCIVMAVSVHVVVQHIANMQGLS